jgi:hypothetical protein
LPSGTWLRGSGGLLAAAALTDLLNTVANLIYGLHRQIDVLRNQGRKKGGHTATGAGALAQFADDVGVEQIRLSLASG